MGRALPLILALAGVGGGVAAGLVLRPAQDGPMDAAGPWAGQKETTADNGALPEYVRMNNQFVVPVMEKGRVIAMVVLSLSLEVGTGSTAAAYSREPKLRDAFLRVLFDHANVGGFGGSFTDGSNLIPLRTSLKEAAVLIIGDVIRDVLITDIARQDG